MGEEADDLYDPLMIGACLDHRAIQEEKMAEGLMSRRLGNRNLEDFSGTLLRETDRALLIDHGGKEPVWVPKSQIEDNGDGTFTGPEWLLKEKGII